MKLAWLGRALAASLLVAGSLLVWKRGQGARPPAPSGPRPQAIQAPPERLVQRADLLIDRLDQATFIVPRLSVGLRAFRASHWRAMTAPHARVDGTRRQAIQVVALTLGEEKALDSESKMGLGSAAELRTWNTAEASFDVREAILAPPPSTLLFPLLVPPRATFEVAPTALAIPSGSLTVEFRGEQRTLTQMGRYQEEPDRPLREEAWRLVASRRLQEAERFERILDDLIVLRGRIATNAGHANYRDYAFRMRGRFDYTPADCERFHDGIEAEVMPVLRRLQARRREQLGVPALRPWDVAVDPLNRPALKPFTETSEMERGSQVIFDRLDPELARGFQTMRDLRLLDLANRKGKAPGGYQSTLSESRLPFIFMNAVGLQRDVETLLHEAGHAFHALATREEPLFAYRGAPIEFCEVASMAMELLGAPHLDVFYSEADARRARRVHLEGIVGVFPWIATVDAFQHWLYTHPGHSVADRSAAWNRLMDRFGGDIDWTGLEASRSNLWHKQLHIFLYPFYYVEYGIAQLGALQVWSNAAQDHPRALADYKAALALGGSRPLPDLFARAGCRFDFSRRTLAPLMDRVQAALAALD